MFEEIDDAYPLTPLQEGMLYEVLKAPDSDVYVAYVLIDIQGVLNESVFKQAWHQTLMSHDTLRTRFVWEGLDEPLQLVDSKATLQWDSIESSQLVSPDTCLTSPNQRLTDDGASFADVDHSLVEQWLKKERSIGMSLSDQPPLRFRLIHLASHRSVLIWVVHHLLADDWSTPIVLKSVLDNYSLMADSTAQVDLLQRDAFSFSSYVDWLNSTNLSESTAWWRGRLKLAVPTPMMFRTLPASSDVHGEQPFHPRLICQLDTQTANSVSAFALRTGVTQSTLFHAAWALTLSQFAATMNPMFGTSVSGRTCPLPNIESAVGLFLNTLPTRIEIDSKSSAVEFVQSVQALLFEQLCNEHVPLSVLQSLQRRESSQALFETVLVVESHGTDPDLVSVNSETIRFSSVRYETDSNYPLTVLVFPGELPEVHFLAKTTFVDYQYLQVIRDAFIKVLQDLCNAENASTGAVLQQQQQRLIQNIPVATPLPKLPHASIDEWFVDTALKNINATAIVHDKRLISYGMLLHRSISLANDINQLSPSGDCVGVFVGRSIEQIVGVLAAVLAGKGYLALDVEWPLSRLHSMVDAAGVNLVISRQSDLQPLGSLPVTVLSIDGISTTKPDSMLSKQLDNTVIASGFVVSDQSDATRLAVAAEKLRTGHMGENSADRLAYQMFTSGSSGTPKAVPISQQNIVYSTCARVAYYRSTPISFLLLSSLAFDSSVAGLFWTLCSGGALILQNGTGNNDIAELTNLITDHAVTHTLCLPSLYSVLLQFADADKLKSLGTVIVAGEACPASLTAHHKRVVPGASLYNEYGPTEATVWASVAGLYTATSQHANSVTEVPIGTAIPGANIVVLDTLGKLCPPGVIGEIVICSPGVVSGYRNDSTASEAHFTQLSLQEGEWPVGRSYRTGDLGYVDAHGELFYQGRIDDQIKIRGYRIEPGEISARVELHEDVYEAFCIPVVQNPHSQEELTQLVCYAVLSSQLDTEQCRILEGEDVGKSMLEIIEKSTRRIKDELPEYFSVSAFVPVSSLPRLPNGKIDKQGFPSPQMAVEHPQNEPAEIGHANARTIEILCQLLGELLGSKKVSSGDNFFSLGADSLTAIRFVAVCREQGIALTIPMVSQYPTLAALGDAIEQSAVCEGDAREPDYAVEAYGKTPLTPVQRWFFSQCAPYPEHWNMGFVIDLAQDVYSDKIIHAIKKVVRSLPVLGTCFSVDAIGWSSTIPEHVEPDIQVMPGKGTISVAQWATTLDTLQKRFDLSSGRLTGFAIRRDESTGKCRYIGVVIHHLVTDALSNQFIASRIERAITDETSPSTPSLSETSYRAWASHIQRNVKSPKEQPGPVSSEASKQTWLENDVVNLTVNVSKQMINQLATVCAAAGVERHEAILFSLLKSTSEQLELRIDIETHGRDLMDSDIDLSSSIGWFTSFFRIVSDKSATSAIGSFRDHLRHCRKTEQHKFIQDSERYFIADDALDTVNGALTAVPFLYNYLASVTDGVSDRGLQRARCYPLLDARLRHAQSPRTHPIECVVMDAELEGVDVHWRIDGEVAKSIDIACWQEDFKANLEKLSKDIEVLDGLAEETFAGSGLGADELERLLLGLD